MVRRDYHRLCVYPLQSIIRKVTIYTSGVRETFLIVDPDHIVTCSTESIVIPYYPKSGEIVKIKSSSQHQQGLILVFDVAMPNVQGYKLKKLQGSFAARWRALKDLSNIVMDNIISQAIPHHVNAGFYYLTS